MKAQNAFPYRGGIHAGSTAKLLRDLLQLIKSEEVTKAKQDRLLNGQ